MNPITRAAASLLVEDFIREEYDFKVDGLEFVQWHRMDSAPKTGEEIVLLIPDIGERPAEWELLRASWVSPVDGESAYDDAIAWRRPSKGPGWKGIEPSST